MKLSNLIFIWCILFCATNVYSQSKTGSQNIIVQKSSTEVKKKENQPVEQKIREVSPRKIQKSNYTNNIPNYTSHSIQRTIPNRAPANVWNQRVNNNSKKIITHLSENVKINKNVHDYGRKVTPSSRAKVVYHKGISYRYYRGVYYRPYGNTYVISRPPVGAVMAASLLSGLIKISVTANNIHKDYYYDDGVYYVRDVTNNYRVVDAPSGAVIDALPSGALEVIIENNTYYMVGDVYYRSTDVDGCMRFEVVGGVL